MMTAVLPLLRTTQRRAAAAAPSHLSRHTVLIASLSSSSAAAKADLPRITERRPNETGRGGRASDAGVKVALFGATGFLGRYVSSGLGKCTCARHTIFMYCIHWRFCVSTAGGGRRGRFDFSSLIIIIIGCDLWIERGRDCLERFFNFKIKFQYFQVPN